MPQDAQDEERSLGSPATAQLTRRKLFGWLGFGSLALALGGCGASIVPFLTPKVNYEPSTTFTVGHPGDYRPGEMKLFEARQVFIFYSYWTDPQTGEERQGFQALTAVCTHLGCSYKPFAQADAAPHASGFFIQQVHAHCPCHGSIFARDGTVLGGPAPRPLPFFQISLTPDGRLEVDASQAVPPTQYLTPDGKWIDGPRPDGSDIKFT
jgi:cytochrome b6-f complex iron-sulfur subunit